jgi:hypothetical protein
MTGHRGRYFEIKYADLPEVVMTMMAEARHLLAASTAAIPTEWVASMGGSTYENRPTKCHRDYDTKVLFLHADIPC